MKLLILADITTKLVPIPNLDAILTLGDLPLSFLEELPTFYRNIPIISVLGNHDTYALEAPFVNLHASHGVLDNLTLAGLSGCHHYKAAQRYGYSDDEVSEIMSQIPKVDIVISHNSPKGIHDKNDDVHMGYVGLLTYIKQKQPKYLFHGHQHVNETTLIGTTKIIGVYGALTITI